MTEDLKLLKSQYGSSHAVEYLHIPSLFRSRMSLTLNFKYSQPRIFELKYKYAKSQIFGGILKSNTNSIIFEPIPHLDIALKKRAM